MLRNARNVDLVIKIVAAAVAYGILLGKVDQIDHRLARVEGFFYGHVQQPPNQSLLVVPPAEAKEKER